MGQAKKRGNLNERIELAQQKLGLPLYRFFKTKELADIFANGDIWISTLQVCREYDDAQQGDKLEGSKIFNHPPINITNRKVTEEDYKIANHAGIGIPPPGTHIEGSITISNNSAVRSIQNAYLLCTTNDRSAISNQSNQWNYGVKINLDQTKLNKILTEGLNNKKINVIHNKHAWANYDTSRYYNDYRSPPTDLGFIKPEYHKEQSEYRFLWVANHNHKYDRGILVSCPSLRPYLKKLY